MAAKITRDVLESYLHCKYKGYLKLTGQQGTKSDYATLLTEMRAEVRLAAIDKILARHPGEEIPRNVPLTASALKQGASFILDATLDDDLVSLHFDGLKKVEGPSKLGEFHYVPILFHEGNKVRKEQKFLLKIYGLLLSRLQGQMPAHGIVWHGKECKATRVRLNADLRKTEGLLRELKDMCSAESSQQLMLNDHCQVCEFRQRCHSQAVQEDNISLLRGMGEKEVKKNHRKGLFTVTQLSCTFRPRKKSKRAKRLQHSRYLALQALAIRDKKIYVFGTPALPSSAVRIYLDVEGDPDRGFVYLVGMLITENGTECRYSFWADNEDQEDSIYSQFIEVVSKYDNFTLFYYGSYEAAFLKKLRKAMDSKRLTERVRANSCNVLSVIYSAIYFPTYSNGLKDIGNLLGCTWTEPNASGLQSIVWRKSWEVTHDEAFKAKLTTYNTEDCLALRRVTECIYAIVVHTGSGQIASTTDAGIEVASAQDANPQTSRREYCRATFALPDFEFINKCAYFDYQREKVFLRTNKTIRRISARKKSKRRARKLRINRRIEITSRKCPFCKGSDISKLKKIHRKLAYDLKITESGVRRQVIECVAASHYCLACKKSFLPSRYKRRDKHFHALKSWVMYQHVVNRISFQKLEAMLRECFGLKVGWTEIHMIKSLMALYYQKTYKQILEKILSGNLAHVDETHANLQKDKGYVWVLANLEEVAYIYRPTREGDFIQGLLKGFTGVLVSDFYSAYDSIECEQQKCLVHLIRDFNHDLFANPYDEEFRALAQQFGQLLRTIITTIDRYGLKRKHLNKHMADVRRFFRGIADHHYRSELAESYQKRLLKNQDKLFTFLQHDGIPWNNNNAEHAVKHFAYYRTVSDGKMTESGLTDYLVLLSIYQTCKYKGVSFLKFLLSGERDIDKFCEDGHKASSLPSLQLYPAGFFSNHPKRHKCTPKKPSDASTVVDAAGGDETHSFEQTGCDDAGEADCL